MRFGKLAWLLLATAPFLAGCADFWDDSSSISFSLSNGGNILLSSGAAATGTSTITVTPSTSASGTVALTCKVTTSISSAASPATCALSSSSLTFSSTTAQTSTLTATATSSTTPGIYEMTVTGTAGSNTETTSVCVDVTSSSTSACKTSTSSGDFFILNNLTSTYQPVSYSIASSGSRSMITTAAAQTGQAYSMAIAPNGDFLCVSSSDGVYAYPVASGALGSPVKVTSDAPYAIQIDVDAADSSTWLIEAIQGTSGVTMSAIPINSTTGANNGTAHSVSIYNIASADLQKNQLVISPDNTKVFVALGAGGTLVVDFDQTNFFSSASTHYNIPITKTSSGAYGSALSVAVDPNSKFFYIGETLGDSAGSSGGLLACEYADADNDKCTHASGSPFESGGISPLFILPDASGDYVYVANGKGDNKGNITGFAVTSNPISAISSVQTAVQPLGLAEDSTDSYILEVGSKGSPYFASYTFDSTTPGKLDAAATSNVTADSVAIVAAPK